MSRRLLLLLFALSAIWGSSFMFIKVGVRDLEPSTLVLGRVGIAALTLLPLALASEGLAALRAHWWPVLVMGALNSALPFWFLSFGETRIDSGLSAVIQASAPIFTALLAGRIDPSQRISGLRLVGVFVGFAGVALLVGGQRGGELVGTLAVVATALCYATAVLYGGRTLKGVPPIQLAFGTMVAATVLVAPAGLAQLPAEAPGWKPAASVAALGVVGSGLAYILYFQIIQGAGASRAILVTYLVPAFALLFGAVLLDEAVTFGALGGLVLILGGTALATGVARRRAAARE